MEPQVHNWNEIRARPTTLDAEFARRAVEQGSRGFHESLFRASGILEEVKRLLARGDSSATVASFIAWAESNA